MRADRRLAIRMPIGIHRLRNDELRTAVGTILVVLSALVAHDAALDVELLERHRLAEPGHAVGLEEEEEVEKIRRARLEVVRAIRRRRRVVATATALHARVELARRHLLRPHEHQVLEEMREARPLRWLVLRSDVVPEVDRDERQSMVFVKDDRQTVVETRAREGNLLRERRRGRGRREGGDERDRRQEWHAAPSSSLCFHAALVTGQKRCQEPFLLEKVPDTFFEENAAGAS